MKKKYVITEKTMKKHKNFFNFMCIGTYILFFPFAILEIFHDFVEEILSIMASFRNKIVYGSIKLLFKKDCLEENDEDD